MKSIYKTKQTLLKKPGIAAVVLALVVIFGNFINASAATAEKSSATSLNRERIAEWSKAMAAIDAENKKFKTSAKQSVARINREKKQLRQLLNRLKSKTDRQEKLLETKRKKFNQLLQYEEKLMTEIETENEELKTLEGTIRASAKEADALIQENPTSFESPDRAQLVARLLEPDHFPSLDEIMALSNLYFEEADLSSMVKRRTGEFIGTGGGISQGEILRIGTFTTYYHLLEQEDVANAGSGKSFIGRGLSRFKASLNGIRKQVLQVWNPELVSTKNTVGFLRPDTKIALLTAVPQKMPQNAETGVLEFLSNESDVLPVDLSRGAIFQLLTTEKGLSETIESGGIIAWIILCIGLLAVIIGLERVINLVRIKTSKNKVFAEILALVEKDDFEQCREICRKKRRVPAFRVINSILFFAKSDKAVIENAGEEAIMREMPRLERFLSTLGVLYAIAPLLGLLGTVTGMINTFQVISAFGTGDPKMMSGGISEALITTQLGLAVAVPIMLFHHYLERKIDKITADMEERGSALTVALMDKNATIDDTPEFDNAA